MAQPLNNKKMKEKRPQHNDKSKKNKKMDIISIKK